MISPCNVRFLHYKPEFIQKMTGHFFWVVSVGNCYLGPDIFALGHFGGGGMGP
jgi:hypothetical protein